MADNYVTIELSVDADLLEQVTQILKPYGLTPEDAAVMFFEFCANPETQEEAISLLLRWKEEQEAEK